MSDNTPKRDYMEHTLRVAVVQGCPKCKGTGLELFHSYDDAMNCVRIKVRVCSCVRVVII